MLIADGIDPNELLNSLAAVKSGTKAKRAQRPSQNIATLTKTAKLKPGLAKAVLQCNQKKQWMSKVNPSTISLIKHNLRRLHLFKIPPAAGFYCPVLRQFNKNKL